MGFEEIFDSLTFKHMDALRNSAQQNFGTRRMLFLST